ncbi:hypothetical protein NKR23_g12528 [Pleurostoma richardsiae]|uniref:Uncharacterized protein n=1 Tax=Pleurostoma richardsiae TaxID=41990 RepID=A0AA38R7F6_9PEZI|nr:hypothetical protein NKR23_g12528 [Pleurostoma richardsiae]
MCCFLRDYIRIRGFRTICARKQGMPNEIFWALKDVVESFGSEAGPFSLLPFFRAARLSLETTGSEELLIPVVHARLSKCRGREEERGLLEWVWGQFNPRPVTLLPVAQRLCELSPTDDLEAARRNLEQQGPACYRIRLFPYTISEPMSHGEWMEDAKRWHHTIERDVVVALSRRSRLYRRYAETRRRYEISRSVRRRRGTRAQLARWQKKFEVTHGIVLEP